MSEHTESPNPLNLITEPKPTKRVAADGHEYHVSATANATVAPTNAATLAMALDLEGLGPQQAEFVTLIDYEWHLKGDIDIEAFQLEYHYTPEQYKQLATSPPVMGKLAKRGIPIRVINPSAVDVATAARMKLTPLQLTVANKLMDLEDNRSPKKKLQDCGATTLQYQAWMKDETFTSYLRERAESLLGSSGIAEAHLALLDKVRKGDVKAIELLYEINGRFVRQTASQSGASEHDFRNLVIRIIEIIIEEVDDPTLAARISDRLKGLITGVQVADALSNPAPVVPEVAPGRVITPELETLMHKGIGYDQ